MSRKGMLYIDVTQLVHWTGRLTGIPRVMNELSVRFMKKEKTQFVIWDELYGAYRVIDIKKTLDNRGKRIYYFPEGSKTFANNAHSITLKIANKLKSSVIPVPGAIITKLSKDGGGMNTVEINNHDTVFVLWGEQSSNRFIAYIELLHAEGVSIVQLSYDMLPLVTPQYSGHSTESMSKYSKLIFPLCSLIMAISESTKKDIETWMANQKLRVPRVEVFRLGDDFNFSKPKKPTNVDFVNGGLSGKDYVLSVGTIEARKNHTLLYYVYKLACQKKIELPKLIIVGRRGWKADDIFDLMTSDPQTKNKFVILTDTSDEELSWLYKNSILSVYPSFYEGWGLPVAESIAHGTPCVASNSSSIPEIAGDIIDYFHPTSTDQCLDKLVEHLQPKKQKEDIMKLRKYNTTTWDQSFDQVEACLREAS